MLVAVQLNAKDDLRQRGANEFCSDLRAILAEIFCSNFFAYLINAVDHHANINFERRIELKGWQPYQAKLELAGPHETVYLERHEKEGVEVYKIDIKADTNSSLIQMVPDLRRPSTSMTYIRNSALPGIPQDLGILHLYGECSTNNQGRTWNYDFNFYSEELGAVELEKLGSKIYEIIAEDGGLSFSPKHQ